MLTTQEIDGSELAGLTKEDLMSDGLPHRPARKLMTATARLWQCTAIHGVVLAPADDKESERDSVGGTGKILTVRGRDARNNLGGLAQIFR